MILYFIFAPPKYNHQFYMKNLNLSGELLIDREVMWDKTQELVSKTDKFGTIKYCNEAFVNVSGFEEYELIGQSHNIIRHPDMPKVIFKLLWDNLSKGNDFHAVVKNKTKNGRYYWVITQFEIFINENGQITDYLSRRKAVSPFVISKFEAFFKKIKQIEDAVGIEAAEEYLKGFLEYNKMTYEEFLTNILKEDQNLNDQVNKSDATAKDNAEVTIKKKKSFLNKLFG